MKKLLFACLSLVLALCVIPATGQTIVDLRLNEILVKNNNNLNDEYGNHPAWVEVFNTSFNSVNIGGCFLTDDTTGLAAAQKDKEALNTFKASCYHIPTGDPTTLIQQRSCLVFYLDGKADLGTFHVSFTPDHSNYIALIGSDGKTLIEGKDWRWAEYDAYRKRIVYAENGAIYALELKLPMSPKLLYDFSGMAYQRITAPY